MLTHTQNRDNCILLLARIEECRARRSSAWGSPAATVQRMLGASLVASLGVWFLQGALMDAVLTSSHCAD